MNLLKLGFINKNHQPLLFKIKKESLEKENKQLKKAATKTSTQIHSLTLKVAKAKCSKTKQTSKIRAAIQNAKKVTLNNFQKTVKRFFKINKKNIHHSLLNWRLKLVVKVIILLVRLLKVPKLYLNF
jgi:hypothetical protein